VVDHFNYDTKSASEKHEVLLLPSPQPSKKETKNFFSVESALAFPHSVGQVLGNTSPLLQSALKAPKTAYIYNHKESESEALEDVFATGEQISLVTAFQARNSARFTVLGSAEALEDKYFTASVQLPGSGQKSTKTGNRDFARKLAAWTFKEVGVLKVNNIQHRLIEGTQAASPRDLANLDINPSIYRIKNSVAYSISVSEWDVDQWKPFYPPAGDELQLEFAMLSPFHRLNLVPSSKTDNATTFTTEFKLPDQHGIFNFYTEYRRPFYTNVEEKNTVTVRHFAHDEWPRSFVISGAWPWISGIWVTVAGWLGFVALWLYSKPSQPKADLRAGKR
jgi:oligosaccharyltransferase complex subunit beta